jgi:hypothetical protein
MKNGMDIKRKAFKMSMRKATKRPVHGGAKLNPAYFHRFDSCQIIASFWFHEKLQV